MWSELLGLGDFYYELGVQIVEACLATRSYNGGLIPLDELTKLVQVSTYCRYAMRATAQTQTNSKLPSDEQLHIQVTIYLTVERLNHAESIPRKPSFAASLRLCSTPTVEVRSSSVGRPEARYTLHIQYALTAKLVAEFRLVFSHPCRQMLQRIRAALVSFTQLFST